MFCAHAVARFTVTVKPEGVSPKFYKDVSIARLEGFDVGPELIVPSNMPTGTGSPWVVLLGTHSVHNTVECGSSTVSHCVCVYVGRRWAWNAHAIWKSILRSE